MMTNWMELIVNPQPMKSIYGNCVPSLNNVEVHSLVFHRDGPTLSIKLNLNEYPLRPPKKWEVQKFNTVQITLSFSDLKSVNMSGWIYTGYLMSLVVYKENGLILLNAKEKDFELKLEAKFMDVDSISAYLK